jgi:hypothetical protein
MHKNLVALSVSLCLLSGLSRPLSAQSAPAATPGGASQTPLPGEISADLGSCSAVITVVGADSKPIYAAKITARIQYGLLGIKKLDLEAYTGSDGQVKLKSLPNSLKKPVFIHIDKGSMADVEEFKPDQNCHATYNVKLQ